MIATVLAPEFDAATHTYSLNGRPLISVTQTIKAVGLIDDRWFTEDATLRGSYVHKALEFLDEGVLLESSIDPVLAGYVDAYRKFLRECHAGPIALCEEALCDPTRHYAGTVDRVRPIFGQMAVIDLKTGGPSPWHGVQLAAYAELVKGALGVPLLKRWGLYLRPDGTYTCHPYHDRSDWDVFSAALTVAQFARRHGR